MWARVGRTGTTLAAIGVVGVVIIGARADTGTAPVVTTGSAALRSNAQQILDARASLLSGPARLALGMAARGDRALSPGNPTHPDAASRARPTRNSSPADSGNTAAGAASDATAASPPANVLVNNPAEDTHEVDQTTQSETSIAVSGAHVAVGFNDSQNGLPVLTPGDDLAGFAYSDNGGASFTDGGPVPNATGLVNLGDPWLATDPAGAMYYANLGLSAITFQLDVVVSRSSDGGHHWSTPVVVSPATSSFYTADKDALAAGVGPDHSGSAVYAAWDDFSFPAPGGAAASRAQSGSGGTPTPSPTGSPTPSPSSSPSPCGKGCGPGPTTGLAVSHSYDGGQTWQVVYADQLPLSFSGCSFAQYFGAYPAVDNTTGTLYVASERIDISDPTCGQQPPNVTFSQRLFTSTDGGNTFGPGIVIATVNPVPSPFVLGPVSAMRDAEFPSLALSNGAIYVAWNDAGTLNGSAQVRLARSDDGGATWKTRFITAGSGERIQPALSADASGLHLLYYRLNPNLSIDAVAADAADATHWSTRVLTTHAFPGVENLPQFDPLLVYTYMGDYIANVSDGTHRYYAWGDNRNSVTNFLWPQGRHDPDVFFARN